MFLSSEDGLTRDGEGHALEASSVSVHILVVEALASLDSEGAGFHKDISKMVLKRANMVSKIVGVSFESVEYRDLSCLEEMETSR